MKFETENYTFETSHQNKTVYISYNNADEQIGPFLLKDLEQFLDKYREQMNIQSLTDRILTVLSTNEKEELSQWKINQASKSPKYTGPIGGGIDYIVSPTSIGPIITVKNNITGDFINFGP